MDKLPTRIIQNVIGFLDYDMFNLLLLNKKSKRMFFYTYTFLRKWVKRKFDHYICRELLKVNKEDARIPLLISYSPLNHKYYFHMANEPNSDNIRAFITEYKDIFAPIFKNTKQKFIESKHKDIAELWNINTLDNLSSKVLYAHRDLVREYIRLSYPTATYNLSAYDYIEFLEAGSGVIETFGYHKYIIDFVKYMRDEDKSDITQKLYIYFKLYNKDYDDRHLSNEIIIFIQGFITHSISELSSAYVMNKFEDDSIKDYVDRFSVNKPTDLKFTD